MFEASTELINSALRLLSKYPLCDYCLGRQFATVGPGLSNWEKGRSLKTVLFMISQLNLKADESAALRIIRQLSMSGYQPATRYLENSGHEVPSAAPCFICEGYLDRERFKSLAEKILKELNGYEFDSLLLGARVPPWIREKEDTIRSECMIITGQDIKEDVTREIGRIIQRETGKEIDYKAPDIVVIVDLFKDTYELQVNPLFVKGRYRKLRRDLPQTPWYCRSCWGRGCQRCDYTGREYPESISELVGGPAVEMFEAVDYKFHGIGREDVDAMVVGSGRPFILELKNPRKRKIDLRALEERINRFAVGKIEVSNLEFSSRRELRLLKGASSLSTKTYEAVVEFDGEVEDDVLKLIEEEFKDRTIDQWTPRRVLRRRADKLRKKKVYGIEVEKISDRVLRFKIRAQGGLYVKELIDGDDGRTTPSIAEVIKRRPLSIQLTVVDVESLGEVEKG